VFKNPFCSRSNNFIALASHAALAAAAICGVDGAQSARLGDTAFHGKRERGKERESFEFFNQSSSPRRRPKPARGEREDKAQRMNFVPQK